MPPKVAMSEEEYWAWYAAATGRKTIYKAKPKEDTALSSTAEDSIVFHNSLVEQMEAAKTFEAAHNLAKTHSSTLPFVGAVKVLHCLARRHRWKKAHFTNAATGAVGVLAEKIINGLGTPSKLESNVACNAVYALAKFDKLDIKLIKSIQKHAEETWDPYPLQPASAAHFVWAVVKQGVRLDHSFFMKLIDNIKNGVKYLAYGDMAELTWAIQKGALTVEGGVRRTTHEDALFESIARRAIDERDDIDAEYLVEIVHNFASLGLKNETMLKALCPKLLAAKLNNQLMSNCIMAYTRFSVPFREDSQGYRQGATVLKGDYQRPSDKPPRKKKKYDKPTIVDWK